MTWRLLLKMRSSAAGSCAAAWRAPPVALLAACAAAFIAGRTSTLLFSAAPRPSHLPPPSLVFPPPHAAVAAAALATPAAEAAPAPLPLFRFAPGVERVWLNVGSHKDPPLPPASELASTAVVALEPILQTAMRVNRSHENVHVVCAALSDAPGFASMETFNSGASSSLSEPAPDRWWAARGAEHRTFGMPRFAFVPVLTLRLLLDPAQYAMDLA